MKQTNAFPGVGIILATFNPHPNFLREQLQSLINQTYRQWKCLILDDASTMPIGQDLKDLIANDERFEIQVNEKNLGSFHTFEKGALILSQRFELICFADQDDIWEPEKLQRQVMIMQDPAISLVHSDQMLIDEQENILAESCWTLESRDHLTANSRMLLFRSLVTGCTMMIRRQVLSTALPFIPIKSKKVPYHHDLWIAMHACLHGRIHGIEEPLVLYRQHEKNLVGVSGLRKKGSWQQLLQNASIALAERKVLKAHFLKSILTEKNHAIEIKKLSYIDSLAGLIVIGLPLTRMRLKLLRVWVMLVVGHFMPAKGGLIE